MGRGSCEVAARSRFRARFLSVGSSAPLLLLCALVVPCVWSAVIVDAKYIVAEFSEPQANAPLLNHLEVDDRSGSVFVGAKNRLFQLDTQLRLTAAVRTGPELVQPQCSHSSCPEDMAPRLVDSHNKALVIDRRHSRLVACGSLRQGRCEMRALHNISHLLAAPSVPVVANNASSSTVAFLASGPAPQSLVLYVAVTYTPNAIYRDDVPAVASRSLNNDRLLEVSEMDVTSGTRISFNSLSRERYLVNYVFGFGSQGFSYFLTTQMVSSSDEKSPYISKLVRVCHNDKKFWSYTEIPVDCKDETGAYNLAQAAYMTKPGPELAAKLDIGPREDVLYVVFSKSVGNTNKPSNKSALCVFSLKAIRRVFTQNVRKCYNGVGSRGLEFISTGTQCFKTQSGLLETVGEDFCGLDVNTPIGGNLPVTSVPVLTFNSHLTAVVATTTGRFTVVFIGTADGHIKKVVVEPVQGRSSSGRLTRGIEYADLVVQQGSPVQADLRFDQHREHVYVMTQKKVSKVKVQECHLYRTCGDCLGARDPYCGWCSLENKCSVRSNCQDAAKDALYWINYRSDRCTTIQSVEPKQLQATTTRTLTLSINNLPKPQRGVSGSGFVCVFSLAGKTLLTNATQSPAGSDTLTCSTPRIDHLPPIPQGQHFMTAKLAVRMRGGHDFVATDFAFYNCNRYSRCSQCVSSPFPCDWCIDGDRCTHDTAEDCRNDVLVTGVNRIGPSSRSGPKYCPKINSTTDGTTQVLVPAGSRRSIKVKVENIPRVVAQGRFVCQFNVEGRVEQTIASLLGTDIYCNDMLFDYTGPQPNISVTFAVVWAGSKPLDNPANVHILVYRCSRMADNCGECLALSRRLQCGWCAARAGDGLCSVRDSCLAPSTSWLHRSKVCPNPQIVDFSPKSGPYEGGTNITINGFNLGKQLSDFDNRITVDGVHCQVLAEGYIKTRRIMCRVDGPGGRSYRRGPIGIRVADTLALSNASYEFVDPRISAVRPARGPRSGGTRLRISGAHMDAGAAASAAIDGQPCRVLSRSRSHVECVNEAGAFAGARGRVSVSFDGAPRYLAEQSFTYVDDPRVTAVANGGDGDGGGVVRDESSATDSLGGGPRGIVSGGLRVQVRGDNLMYIQRPLMVVYRNDQRWTSECHVMSNDRMECVTPSVPQIASLRRAVPRAEALSYGFIMDNVASVRNLTNSLHSRFLLFPDPSYEQFSDVDGIKYYKSDYLTINGNNLNLASDENDVRVRIGTASCNVTSLSLTQLTCKPPRQPPSALGSDGRATSAQLPKVIVYVGGRNYTIGQLSYAALTSADTTLPQPVLIGVVVAAVVLVVMVVCVVIVFKRKSSENSRVLKNMQEQMDVLELRVAAECKEAFAELQTEMTDLTSDITGLGIPFLDYRTYCMKILFPNHDDHPVLQWSVSAEMQRREKCLRLFGQLVINKTFLLIFVRTLESNRYFSMRDRVNVASLLMVTLQSRMEYCTDILKTLLSELIEKCTEPSGSHPKLLLRRTESVAEKMLSSWFTFLLYKFMRECAGEPLYLLYRAIKQQVDKGPVDAVTSEARYSLSEEKLIRHQVDYAHMMVYVSMPSQTIYVSGLDPHQDNVDIAVRVLNTDCIGQVKEKCLDAIYRSTPFSMRPHKNDLDLEWRTGTSGRLILYDEDSTTKLEAGWRKLNTLAHYRVPDGALLTLVPRQTSLYNLSILSDKSDKSHKYETLNLVKYGGGGGGGFVQSPSLSRDVSPLNHDNGVKVWHLVRHSESESRDSCERTNKMVSEIYLTRLLATKGTLQKFMDDLFETIFSTAHRGSALPLAIKYMFDYLDDQALQYGIFDPDTVHTWKSNSLPLRFWVNLIKNPNFVFDINKTNIVDSCLSVVAQTFMDSCSTSDNKLGKDSPSSKLLYAKDIPIYKEWVIKYYDDIKMMPAISDQDMNAMLAEESRLHQQEFNTNCALHELYAYAVKYNDQLMSNLEEDEFSNRQRLALKLEQVHKLMAGEPDP